MSTEVAPAASTPLQLQHTVTSKEGTRRSSGKKKKRNSHSDGGYSSTTERRNDRFLEHEEAIIKDHSYTNQCYLTTSILLFFLMIGLIGINTYQYTAEKDPDQVPTNVPYALQTTRKGLAIASENLDCSLLAKRLHGSLKYLDSLPVLYMIALLMCLHITEPHSVASDSAISMMFHLKNDKNTFMKNLHYDASQKRRDLDIKTCAFGNEKNIECINEAIPNILNGHVHLDEEITESTLNSQMHECGRETYMFYYKDLFRLFFNNDDGGDNEYKEATKTKSYEEQRRPRIRAEMSQTTYAFPVSPLFAKLSQNRTLPPHIKKLTGTPSVSKWTRMKMTEGVTRELMEKFLRDKQEMNVTQAGTLSFALCSNNSKEEYSKTLFVSIPKGATLSVISAFIVKVVHDSMLTMKFEGKTIEDQEAAKESTMYTLIALSHRLAIDLLPESEEWTGFGSRKSLMSRADEFVEIARRTPIKDVAKVFQKYSRAKKVRRIYWDRVSSFLMWKNSDLDTAVHALSASLPRLFRSAHYGKKRGEHARFTNGDDISQPFMSSAGIFISQKEFLDATDEKVIYAATSSGSVRTVDAVVIPILRMFLFNEEPGKAVTAPAVYFDPRRRKFFCESENTVSHPSFADHSKRVQEAVTANGVRCIHPNSKNFASIDRSGIVMHRKAGDVEDIVAAKTNGQE